MKFSRISETSAAFPPALRRYCGSIIYAAPAPIAKAAEHAQAFLTVEMSMGQMVDDVKLAVEGKKPVHFFGRTGGIVPTVREIITEIETLAKGGR